MMRHILFLALLPLLAACGTARAPAPEEAPTPLHAACQKEAENAPALRQLAGELNPNNLENRARVTHEMRVAKLRAYRECLRRNGLASPGGVEAVAPR